MDSFRFDQLARSFAEGSSRRTALRLAAAAVGIAAVRVPAMAEAKSKNKKKPKPNAYGCLDVGKACRGKDAKCCSGICQGKKPKKGKKDKSKCLAHNVLDCEAGADTCLENKVIPCGTSGRCYQTTGQASFCGEVVADCFGCTKDVQCEAVMGPGAACTVCPGGCGPTSVTTQCHAAAD